MFGSVETVGVAGVFGQVMGLVAVTLGFFTLGAYLGRHLSEGASLVCFIGGFVCIVGLNFARRRESLAITLLFAVALTTGMSVSGGGVDIFGLIGLALIINLGAGLFSGGIALRFRSIQAGPLMQTPVFLILFLAPVYVPLPLLTGWIHAVATVNPLTAVLQGASTLLAGDTGGIALAFGAP